MILSFDSFLPLYQFVAVAFLVVGVVRFLHWKGIFTDDYQPVFDRLVTELALPAIIFSTLVTSTVPPEMVVPIITLFAGLITALCIAWGICRALHLPPKTTGTLVMVSGFGSTATMAIPIVTKIFPTVTQAYEHALVIGTFGVALPFFTIGVLISSYFGTYDEYGQGHIIRVLKEFLTTPIFIAFVLGCILSILLSSYQIPGAVVFTDIFTNFFTIIYQSGTVAHLDFNRSFIASDEGTISPPVPRIGCRYQVNHRTCPCYGLCTGCRCPLCHQSVTTV